VHALAEEQETAEMYPALRGVASTLQSEATAALAPTNHAATTTTPAIKPRRRFDQNTAPTGSFVREDTAAISRPDTITRPETKTISGPKSVSTMRWVRDYLADNIARSLNVTSLPDRATRIDVGARVTPLHPPDNSEVGGRCPRGHKGRADQRRTRETPNRHERNGPHSADTGRRAPPCLPR
jgi:hypothetical protein